MNNLFNQVEKIYEDQNILALSKPAGLLTHNKSVNSKEETLADWILKNYPSLKSVGENIKTPLREIEKPGLVHRLDRETSGIILVAKNQETYLKLKNLFQERKIKKIYYALVWGSFKKKKGEIIAPIGRGKKGKFTSQKIKGKAREAITFYKVIKNYKEFSLLEVFPKTGRTNQIRIHLSLIGHPIVCDKIFTPKKTCPPQLNRLFLHAYSLEFSLEKTKYKIECPLPDELLKFLDFLK